MVTCPKLIPEESDPSPFLRAEGGAVGGGVEKSTWYPVNIERGGFSVGCFPHLRLGAQVHETGVPRFL